MPLLSILGAIFFVSFSLHAVHRGVLSYATNISTPGLLQDTNQQRLANHVSGLAINNKLTSAAQAKANDMAARNYWSHNTPEGNPPWIFIDNTGYHYQKAGENLAYGFDTSSDTITGWMNSPAHRENLLNGVFSEVGFGIANASNYQTQGEETIVVAMYAQPQVLSAATSAPPIQAVAPQQKVTKVEPQPASETTPAKTTESPTTSSAPTSDTKTKAEPKTQPVTYSQLITKGKMPWINSLVVLVGVVGLGTLLLRHSLRLRRVFKNGERFALHHPLFDVTLISFLGLCILLVQAAGTIR